MSAEETKRDVENLNETSALIRSLSERAFAGFPPAVAKMLIAAIMLLGEEYFVEFNFRCPCVEASECGNGTRTERHTATLVYGVSTILFTAVVIFCLAFLANATFKWKSDGCCRCRYGLQAGDCCSWLAQSLFVTSAWVTISLIDGDYWACAATCNAYDVSCSEAATTEGKLPFSELYKKRKETSHFVGCILGVCLVVLYGLLKSTSGCCGSECGGGVFEKFWCFCSFLKCCCTYDKSLRPPNARKIDKKVEEYTLKLKQKLPSKIQEILDKMEAIQTQLQQGQKQGIQNFEIAERENI